jgi:hypothetical protein
LRPQGKQIGFALLFILCSSLEMKKTESRIAPSPEAASDDFASPSNLSPAEARLYWRGVADGLARAGAPVPPDVSARAAVPCGEDLSPPGEAPPWEAEPPEEAGRQRHDAFTHARKREFLDALSKCGCILDACRKIGVSSQTVYNHQERDEEFARHCELAAQMGRSPAPIYAWERAVHGVAEDVIQYGKVVGTRLRRSDMLLRMFCQAADPKRYGPRPGFTRKRLLKHERKQMEREIRASLAEHRPPIEQVTDRIVERVQNIKRHRERQRRAEGWTELGCGVWVPPGWVWTGEGDPREAIGATAKVGDSVSDSSNSSTSVALASPSPDGEGDQVKLGGGVSAVAQEDPAREPPAPAPSTPPPPFGGPPPHAAHGEASLPPNPPNP